MSAVKLIAAYRVDGGIRVCIKQGTYVARIYCLPIVKPELYWLTFTYERRRYWVSPARWTTRRDGAIVGCLADKPWVDQDVIIAAVSTALGVTVHSHP